ncbi:NAD(P)/FAD-dependent oxidoreductase [Pseudovibrio sp. Tun.PSC04-5.I4]|uniref:FAD/NAD(P)-dependent oxidoreductase n=1 Tax=Pseudovibrio sp. Tun.PSC04-5.I4 TaxID=1798213 RepID=UPI0008900F30|nr:NAD(P)/FAD-dependent oxidoreductase [Pseudovibrio sp. Tun.PSC04-5.I4]SDQ24181.1 Pyruvate/2-oxoglutarate dehydrogenase complex, dihydrolipoamide dehydrogenase (E3) component [Pseudovibrio sp. Tun.PSC04-5.I4]
MSDVFDIAIIGAGPAGMSAALQAAQSGASVIVLDRKATPGGQIYRNVTDSPLENPSILGSDYTDGEKLVRAFLSADIERHQNADVWHIGENGEVLYSVNNQTRRLVARELIISPGAMERPFPIEGWQLPGVMTAGSAQVMLKSDGLVKDNAIFAGCGPLLYLIVAQYLRLGVTINAVVDTTPAGSIGRAFKHVGGALKKPAYLVKGLLLLNEIRRAGVPVFKQASDLNVIGESKAVGLQFKQHGRTHSVNADHVFLHQGVIPNLNMTRALGMEHHWSEQQLCWTPTLDEWGQSSIPHIAVVGDAAGIQGAEAAQHAGQLAGLNALCNLGKVSKADLGAQSTPHLRAIAAFKQFRQFLDAYYPPARENRIPTQSTTLVCRCEEQTMGQLRAGFEQGATDPNALKALTRCGMGPCQGRQCGHTVSELLADWQKKPVSEVGYYRLRSPQRLLSLEELSHFQQVQPSMKSAEVPS